ncbi:hypothetical protein B0H17DRAFT_1028373 [Mycena rosella]|uniref:Uncharacterized protein n=1 Tax=Mycena rosella TaxID=1033263 RepID=A0AAD7MBQ7_MYCRO|nr:hypothetical protein B0H17DRAFT_1028373 [Mycena rosella]
MNPMTCSRAARGAALFEKSVREGIWPMYMPVPGGLGGPTRRPAETSLSCPTRCCGLSSHHGNLEPGCGMSVSSPRISSRCRKPLRTQCGKSGARCDARSTGGETSGPKFVVTSGVHSSGQEEYRKQGPISYTLDVGVLTDEKKSLSSRGILSDGPC